uniref:SEC63 domain-containing protein n=1 Tax=Eptatretus burgeri TaxID=7764 RepID=A0A8C4NDJ7_EPTBU
MDKEVIKPTENGRLMAGYCISFETMKMFGTLNESETLQEMITLFSTSQEFSDIQLRVSEKRALNALNASKTHSTIRFPLSGKIKSGSMKVNCLIQAQLGCLPVTDFPLVQDTAKIFRIGLRLVKCYSDLQRSKKTLSSVLTALLLVQCFKAKLWENSLYVSRQLENIGECSIMLQLFTASLMTF